MPRKRSKSEEREIKKRYRENGSNEQILKDKEKDNKRKRIEWEEKEIMRNDVKIKMRKFRAKNSKGAGGKIKENLMRKMLIKKEKERKEKIKQKKKKGRKKNSKRENGYAESQPN